MFWDLDVTRDGGGTITAVDMTRIATLGETSDFQGSGREARFSNDGGPGGSGESYLVLTNEKDYLTRIYKLEDLASYTGPQNDQSQVPQPFRELRNGDESAGTLPAFGTEVEPADFAKNGRFFVNDGDSRDPSGNPNGLVFPGFLRVYDTAEWASNPAGQEPDPIWVQRALSTEYINFNHDDTKLATGHGDGTLRVWDVNTTGAVTVKSEAFNENTSSHTRWTLAGSRSTSSGDNEWGTSSQVLQNGSVFVGHRGTQYLAVDNLEGETHTLTMNAAWDISGFVDRKIQFAAAAAPGAFEGGDFLRLLADLDENGTFETTVAQFLPDGDGDLAWDGSGAKLNDLFEDDSGEDFYAFQDFFVDLESLLPGDFGGQIRFQIQANTDDSAEEIGFDSLRVTGVPEPGSMGFLALGALAILRRRRRGDRRR
ncbi:MAG: PEP-CTERM sorting domain-containing protein [Planctomycetes bacterium]|nr:PEP-CTERM sorting domain-containing protein [Planctomycetota bacterium]